MRILLSILILHSIGLSAQNKELEQSFMYGLIKSYPSQSELTFDIVGPLFNFYGNEVINYVLDSIQTVSDDLHPLIQSIDNRGTAYAFTDKFGYSYTAMLYPAKVVADKPKLVIIVNQ